MELFIAVALLLVYGVPTLVGLSLVVTVVSWATGAKHGVRAGVTGLKISAGIVVVLAVIVGAAWLFLPSGFTPTGAELERLEEKYRLKPEDIPALIGTDPAGDR